MRTRHALIERASVDQTRRTVPASLSSEEPVKRGGEIEVLRHEPGSVDLTRARDGLPLLFGHDRAAPIGIAENVRVQGGRLLADLRFGQSARASEVWQDVVDGVLRNVSITYSIDGSEPIDGGYAITRWTLYEASVVTIPADPTVGIGREADPSLTHGETHMPQEQTRDQIDTHIRSLVQRHRLPKEFADELVGRGADMATASRAVLDRLAADDEGSGGHLNVNPQMRRHGAGLVTRNASPDVERAAEQMADALASRIGGPALKEENPYRGVRIVDMARDCLEFAGVRTTGMSAGELVERSLHTTSDFPNLLTNTGSRVLRNAYDSYQGGIKRICKSSTARDFRAKQRLALGEAPALVRVNESGEFKYGTMAETKESYALATYGRIFGISRQALINDDLDAFGEMAIKYGRAAAEFESQFLVTLLTSNPTLAADGLAVFHATHTNLGTGAGSALSQTSLSTARAAMRLQKGIDGTTPIDATPAYLVVPAALETTAQQLVTQITPATASAVNPFAGRLEPVVDPRLDTVSATAWYLAASPDTIDTIEYAYLESEAGPQVFMDPGFEIDGVRMKVRLDFGGGILDFRGLYKANGV